MIYFRLTAMVNYLLQLWFIFPLHLLSPLLCSCLAFPSHIPCLATMSLNTRPENKNKWPSIVDLSPQRCKLTYKKPADEKSTEDQQTEESHLAGIHHVSDVEERNREKLKHLMAPGPKPRPRIVTAASNTASSTSVGKGKHIHILSCRRYKTYGYHCE